VQKILHRQLKLHAYKIQIVQELEPNDGRRRKEFAMDMLDRIDNDNGFLDRVIFSDESTFHVCGIINRHNGRIWGSESLHAVREYERDSPKLNVPCAVSRHEVIGPFFFQEKTLNGTNYLDMRELFAVPQMAHIQPNVFFQQDGAPPHCGLTVRESLNQTFPNRWIGRDGPIPWPPRSPDITTLDFFFWDYVKDQVFRTKVGSLVELRARINNAVASETPQMLENTWREIEYRLDSLRTTNGAHIEMYCT
jgi:hypothetical protein